MDLPGGSVGHEGRCRGWRRSLWFGWSRLPARFGGGGGRLLGGVGEPTGDAAAGGRVPVVTEVSQAGAARVSCAVAWRRRRGEESNMNQYYMVSSLASSV